MLHDDKRVARFGQAAHDAVDAMHVARMQADGRFVQNKQRVDEGRAQCRREAHALHFTARERAALSVERQVADAHVAKERQARADFVQQHLLGFVGACAAFFEEVPQVFDRERHELVVVEAGQLRVGTVGKGHADRLEDAAFDGLCKHELLFLEGAVSPEERRLLQVGAAARGALRVGTVA